MSDYITNQRIEVEDDGIYRVERMWNIASSYFNESAAIEKRELILTKEAFMEALKKWATF